jgi:hypothetical protein
MQRKDERNRKFTASAFVSEYRALLENDKAIMEKVVSAKTAGAPISAAQVNSGRGQWYYAYRKRDNAHHSYAIIEELLPESSTLLQDVLLSLRNGNSALASEIIKTKPNTQAAFAGGDILAWSKYVHADKKTAEKGMVTLAMQCAEGGAHG